MGHDFFFFVTPHLVSRVVNREEINHLCSPRLRGLELQLVPRHMAEFCEGDEHSVFQLLRATQQNITH